MLVEVWSDVVCPWCYIGKRRFAAATAELAADPTFGAQIEVVYRPYQLDPNAPVGTTMPVLDAYARKFGGPERAQRIVDDITRLAAAEGLDFHLERARRANTRDAHRVLWFAETHGPAGAQAELKERLLAAYFIEGRNVGDHDVLVAEAAAAGLDADAVRGMLDGTEGLGEIAELLAFARDAEIAAVPTYVIDRRWSIPGAQDPAVFVQVLRRLAATERAG
ncbi:MAG: DsbA family oxidoreductase [Ilumatobacteraceae bacterium]